MNNVRVHLYISGRVQGVFFRHNTMKKAIELGLTGWVKNRPDRTVEAVFEGAPERVDEMIRWCFTGEAPANVTDVKQVWEEPTGEFDTFRTRY